MMYFFWSLPALVVLATILSGRTNITVASVLGVMATIPVALLAGPTTFALDQLTEALLRGLWIGAVITPYILGGLLFWQVAARGPADSSPAMTGQSIGPDQDAWSPLARRRMAFFACFLIGPFAESVTGFGVGMLGTVILLRRFNFAPRHLMVFALLSQTVIPWGAMSSGTLLAAAYARIPAVQLALHTAIPVALLMLVWLGLFWQTARRAGLSAGWSESLREITWIVTSLLALAVATLHLGPETALLAAYGPLIVLRYLLDLRPDRRHTRAAARKILPYVLLIGGLALSRLQPELRHFLSTFGEFTLFDDLPAWSPLFHAGSWLIAGSLIILLLRRQAGSLRQEAGTAWRTGKHAVLTLFLFAMMAEVLTAAGISGAFASATFTVLGEKAILVTPLLSGGFAVLANSGNPANSLFMPSQVALAYQAGLSIPAVAALQHASGMCLGFFSPVRMSIAASLAGGHGEERRVYGQVLPFGLAALLLLIGMAMWVASTGRTN